MRTVRDGRILRRYSKLCIISLVPVTLTNACAGVCMWEVMSYGVKPWPELQNNEVIDVVERGERLSRPSTCPLAVYTLMSTCWTYRPSDRPSFAAIKARLRYCDAM